MVLIEGNAEETHCSALLIVSRSKVNPAPLPNSYLSLPSQDALGVRDGRTVPGVLDNTGMRNAVNSVCACPCVHLCVCVCMCEYLCVRAHVNMPECVLQPHKTEMFLTLSLLVCYSACLVCE